MPRRNFRSATLIVGVLLTMSGCSYFHSAQTPDDNAITSAIQAKLFQDPQLKRENIQVVSQKGVVVLSGTVSSSGEKAQAEQLANSVSGVKQVIDELAVGSSSRASEAEANPAPVPREPSRQVRRRSSQAAGAPAGSAAESSAPTESPTAAQPAASSAPAPPPQPVTITLPAGTSISVRTIDQVDSAKNHVGDIIHASIAAPVIQSGQVVIPQDANAELRVTQVASAGHIKGRSEVQLKLVSVSAGGVKYPVVSSAYLVQGASRGKRSAETIGGGAALGALIGALAGHGKGAAIGAAVGAGAGTAVQETTHAQEAVIPSETKINFTLRQPLAVTSNP